MKTAILSGLLFRLTPRLCAAAAFCAVLSAASGMDAAPLPPPPELIADGGYDPDDFFGDDTTPADPEQVRRALEPPAAVAPPAAAAASPAARPAVPAPAPGVPAVQPPVRVASVRSDFTVSPPASDLPADYYHLPVADLTAAAIPGVTMPVMNHEFSDPGFTAPPAARRTAAGGGLSIRQLEPFFALAKGSESMALQARETGREDVYFDQIGKAVDAYMAIIGMADAGTEAREEAWYGVARCEYRRSNWWQAFNALERSFPKQYERREVAGRIKLQMFIGERLWRIGSETVEDTADGGTPLTGYQAAAKVYAAAVYNQPAATDAPLALLRQGDAAAMEEDWDEAVRLYRQAIEYYPDSDPAMQARSSLAAAVLRKEWEGGLPEKGREDLESLMDDVERQYGQLSPEAEERRREAVELGTTAEAEKKLEHAKAYLRQVRVRKSRDSAVFLLGDIVSLFPNTPQAEEAADILRGMGIEPPMVLSDGTRFPLSRGWAGEEEAGRFGGGSIRLDGQDDTTDIVSPSLTVPPGVGPSPTRETVYEAFDFTAGE